MTNLKNIAMAIASIVVFNNIANAQATKAAYSVNFEAPLKVKYLCDDGSYLRFEISIESKTPVRAKFTIDDSKDGILYSSLVEAPFKMQIIKIEKSDFDALNFKLFLGNQKYSKSFSVNTKIVETTTVSEKDVVKF